MGGRFVLSDDSHAVDHVGFGYRDALQWLQRIGVERISTLAAQAQLGQGRNEISSLASSVGDLLTDPFFNCPGAADDNRQG